MLARMGGWGITGARDNIAGGGAHHSGRKERQTYRDRGPVVLSGVSGVSCVSEALSPRAERLDTTGECERRGTHQPSAAARHAETEWKKRRRRFVDWAKQAQETLMVGDVRGRVRRSSGA